MRAPSPYMSEQIINDLCPKYLSTLRKPSTKEKYYSAICLFCDAVKKDFLSINEEDVQSYFSSLKHSQKSDALSKKTVLARISYLNGFGKYVEMHTDIGFTNYFGQIIRPEMEDEIPLERLPSMSDLDSLLTAAREEPMYFLLFSMCIRCSFSVAELVAMKDSQVIVNGPVVTLFFSSDSVYEPDRYVPLPEDISDLFLTYRASLMEQDSEHHLFYNRHHHVLTLKNLDDAVHRFTKLTNIKTTFSFKDIRSKAIIAMLQGGASPLSVAEYCGISALRVSQYVAAAGLTKPCSCPANMMNFTIKNPNTTFSPKGE